jgi:hypothetical protein
VSSNGNDRVLMAKHLSQAGYLGMAWFQRLNRQGIHHISNEAFVLAVALHLSLPVAAFEGLTCGCGCALTAASGPLHIVSCNQFAKLPRSETFQHAFDSIIYDVCPDARIEGAKPLHGQQQRCRSYAEVPVIRNGAPVIDATSGQPAMRSIIPDRVVRNMLDDRIGLSGRYIIDTAVPSPEAGRHVDAAATTPLAAAARTHARKYQVYTPVLKQHDVLLAVVCESWGGVHGSVLERLRKWAGLAARFSDSSSGAGGKHLSDSDESLSSHVLSIWRMRLSCALLLGRVGLVFSAIDKLMGVPARSSTVAYRISHPLVRAQEFGRLRG